MQALRGIRVLDLSRLLPGPFLTMVLSDLGADVIKIEGPPVGDYLRAIPPSVKGVGGRFLAVNRDKRSVGLDLKNPSGREAFLRMVEGADVVVESFRPGVMDRLGVGWDTLSAVNPRLVMCSISGYGATGPYRERAGHDLNYIALAGVLGMTGPAGGAPQMPGVQIADLAGGALWGAVGVLGALLERERAGAEGLGRHLDISMAEGALALLAPELGNLFGGATPPTRGAETLNGGMACYSVYRTSDDRWLAVGALEPKFWMGFNQAIGRKGDMGELVAPPAKQEVIRGEVQAILATKTRDEWQAVFATHDVCVEPILELDELPAHPLHAARSVFFEVEHPTLGAVKQVRTPVGEARARSVAPRLGEHTDEVLGELGFSAAEVATLRKVGALG